MSENVLNDVILSNSLVIHLHTSTVCWFHSVKCDAPLQWLGCRTCDQQVASLTAVRALSG